VDIASFLKEKRATVPRSFIANIFGKTNECVERTTTLIVRFTTNQILFVLELLLNKTDDSFRRIDFHTGFFYNMIIMRFKG
jgi:hypothetical protein